MHAFILIVSPPLCVFFILKARLKHFLTASERVFVLGAENGGVSFSRAVSWWLVVMPHKLYPQLWRWK